MHHKSHDQEGLHPGSAFCLHGDLPTGGSTSRGRSASGGLDWETRKAGNMHPTGMLSCLWMR